MNKLEDIQFQHKDHQEWLNHLNFYQDEIKILQNELLLVLYEHPENLSLIEHVEEYRGILLKKLSHIDDLRHAIMQHEHKLATGDGVDEASAAKHREVSDQVSEFEGQFEAMKASFRRFVSHNDSC